MKKKRSRGGLNKSLEFQAFYKTFLKDVTSNIKGMACFDCSETGAVKGQPCKNCKGTGRTKVRPA